MDKETKNLDSVKLFVYERISALKAARAYLETEEPDYDFKTLDTVIRELESVLKVIDTKILLRD